MKTAISAKNVAAVLVTAVVQAAVFSLVFGAYYEVAWIHVGLTGFGRDISFWMVLTLVPLVASIVQHRSWAVRSATFPIFLVVDAFLAFHLIFSVFAVNL